MKSTIRKILVPVDLTESTEAVIMKAVTIAKKIKADICLLHVLAFNDYYFSIVPEVRTILPTINEIELAVKKQMDGIQASIAKKYGITPKVYVTTGNIETEVITFSKNEKIDLIIMGTHGASGPREFFIGSNAQQVVALSEIPVLTMQNTNEKTDFRNILIPIDNSLHSREKLNISLMIADLFGSKIHVLGLLDSTEQTELKKFKIKMDAVEDVIRAEKLPFTASIRSGDHIAQAALSYAEMNKCDLIVINTGHESKITGIFPGAFAQQIVNHSKIPVLSLRPKRVTYESASLAASSNPFA
jgi:nucleotide-binding universal stress UspA family protein